MLDVLARGAQRGLELVGSARWVEPVRRERDEQHGRPQLLDGALERAAAVRPRQVEVRQCARDRQVRIGVKAVGEGAPLVAEVALDLEVGAAERVRVVVAILEPAAELLLHGRPREVCDVAELARDGDACSRLAAGAVEVTALPVRVAHDGVAGDCVERDALRPERRGGSDADDTADGLRVGHRPLEALHPAQRAAGDREQSLDAERLAQEPALRAHHVGDGDDREVAAVRQPRGGVRGRRAGGAAAATDQVRRDNEIPVRVERLAGADHPVPPAEPGAGLDATVVRLEAVERSRGVGVGAPAGGVGVTGERVADEDDVAAVGRERAVGLVGDAHRGQHCAHLELERGREVVVAGLGNADGTGLAVCARGHAPEGTPRGAAVGVWANRRPRGFRPGNAGSGGPLSLQARRGLHPWT